MLGAVVRARKETCSAYQFVAQVAVNNRLRTFMLARRNSRKKDMVGSYYGSLVYAEPEEKLRVTSRYRENYMKVSARLSYKVCAGDERC